MHCRSKWTSTLLTPIFASVFVCLSAGAAVPKDFPAHGPFSHLTPPQLRYALGRLGDQQGIKVELFLYTHSIIATPAPTIHSVEQGRRCLLKNQDDMRQVVSILHELEIGSAPVDSVISEFEVRIWRGDRLILTAIFSQKALPIGNGQFAGMGLINDRAASFDYDAVDKIYQLVSSRMSLSDIDRYCSEYRR